MTLGERLREAREEVGLMQKQAALRAGIGIAVLCRIERDRHEPTLATFAALAKLYDVSMDDLWARSDRPNQTRRRA